MKVSITGANGFLGSYLVKECLQQNMEVHALIRKGANTSLLPVSNELLHIHPIDYKDDLKKQLLKLKSLVGSVNYFIHNAGVTVSLRSREYYDVNVELTKNLVSAINLTSFLTKEGSFVYTSSYAAHGPMEVKMPVSHYGRSKLQAEKVIEEKVKRYLIARPTAIYGYGDVAFLPLFKGASKGLYPVANQDQRMSMIHAADLAHMIIKDMESDEGIIHYSDGKTYLHSDFIKTFESLYKKKIKKLVLPKWLVRFSMRLSDLWHNLLNKRPGITHEKFAEISQHWDLHKSNLKHSSIHPKIILEEGFRDALKFYQKNNLI